MIKKNSCSCNKHMVQLILFGFNWKFDIYLMVEKVLGLLGKK